MQYDILLGGKKLSYELTRKDVKNINLRIKPDGKIAVSAPRCVALKTIEDFLREKTDFILTALWHCEEYAKKLPAPLIYQTGEKIRILGKDMPLLVVQSKKNEVILGGDDIILSVKDTSNFTQKQKTVEQWKTERCREIILSLCQTVYPHFRAKVPDFPEIRFRRMTSRFGSCQPKRGILTFNTALIEAPLSCTEYVVYHEFTHFLHPDHSQAYYAQLEIFLPDWKERRRILNETVLL